MRFNSLAYTIKCKYTEFVLCNPFQIISLTRGLTNLDDDMCEETPFCSARSKATPALLSSGGDSLECQFCEKVGIFFIRGSTFISYYFKQ